MNFYKRPFKPKVGGMIGKNKNAIARLYRQVLTEEMRSLMTLLLMTVTEFEISPQTQKETNYHEAINPYNRRICRLRKCERWT